MPGIERLLGLVNEMHDACRKRADPARVAKYARYFKEGYDAWGVDWDDPAWVEQRRAWLEGNRDLGLEGFLELGRMLFATGKYEHGSLAIVFIREWKPEFRPETLQGLARWFDGGVRNWGHSDVLSGDVLSHFLVSGIAGLEGFAAWRKSPHKYQRRAVPVSMLPLLKAKDVDVAALLDFVRPLMMDGERVVQQGVGWFLREAWKKQPKPVEKSLAEYRNTAPRLIYQYATEKMTPAGKARFRRAKAAAR